MGRTRRGRGSRLTSLAGVAIRRLIEIAAGQSEVWLVVWAEHDASSLFLGDGRNGKRKGKSTYWLGRHRGLPVDQNVAGHVEEEDDASSLSPSDGERGRK